MGSPGQFKDGTPGRRPPSARSTYLTALDPYLIRGARWLELGSGRSLFSAGITSEHRHDILSRPSMFVGIDRDARWLALNRDIQTRVVADAVNLPFADTCFDLITANMVVQHLDHPNEVLREIARVLAPGGISLLVTTNLWNYQIALSRLVPDSLRARLIERADGREPTEIYRLYLRMNTSRKVRRCAEQAGLVIQEIRSIDSSGVLGAFGPLEWIERMTVELCRLSWLRMFRRNLVITLRRPLVFRQIDFEAKKVE